MGFPTIGQPESEEIQEMKKSQLNGRVVIDFGDKKQFSYPLGMDAGHRSHWSGRQYLAYFCNL